MLLNFYCPNQQYVIQKYLLFLLKSLICIKGGLGFHRNTLLDYRTYEFQQDENCKFLFTELAYKYFYHW